jgi:glycosyltransferase involved in cell wall biosynthesis
MLEIYVKVLSVRPQFLIFTIPSPMLLFLSLVVKKNTFGIDIRDASWEYLRKKNLFLVPVCIFFENLLRISCLKAKFVTVTNSFEKESVMRISGVSSTILSNGILKELYHQLSGKCFVKKQNEEISIVYYGNIGIAQHLYILINAIGNQENFTLTLIGNGSELKNLQNLIIDKRFKNVTIKKPVQQEDLAKEVHNADILYAHIGNAYFTAVPTKIFEYLTYGKHIVLGLPDGPAKTIFSSFNGVHIHTPECTFDTFNVLKSVNLSKPVDRELNLNKLKDSFIREDQKQKFLDLI